MKVKPEAMPKPEIQASKKKTKTRDNAQRKARKEQRALQFLQNENAEIKPTYKKGFSNCCGVAQGRKYTTSIAVPGSILVHSPTFESKCMVIAQIARAAAIYSVDEIIIYDDECNLPEKTTEDGTTEIDQGKCIQELLEMDEDFNPCVLMAFILKYLDTPEYLRRSLFPQCACLSNANLLPALGIPSHLRSMDHFQYREGIVLENPDDKKCEKSNVVDAGLPDLVKVSVPQSVDTRITIRYGQPECHVVDRDTPRIKTGAYWGYRVRMANGLSGVMGRTCGFHDRCGESPADCRYDLILGTSERGTNIDNYEMGKFLHLLIVFGGKDGLEHAIEMDNKLPEGSKTTSLFKAYLNTCPTQTTRLIKTEEAVLISLGALRSKICKKGRQ